MTGLKRVPFMNLDGKLVRIKCDIYNNSGQVLLAGTIARLCDKWRGWGLQSVDNPAIYIRCVSEEKFDLLGETGMD